MKKTSILTISLLAWVIAAAANVQVPSDGGPFYARIERGLIHHTDEWAAIAFYRSPDCVPLDFDLLDFFDFTPAFPDGPPRPFLCSSFVSGFEIWKNGPSTDPAPLQSRLQGTGAVPIWFVPWADLEAAVTDNKLPMSELLGLSPLRGIATLFHETLHPSQGAQQTKTAIQASGVLEDGRTFFYQVSEEGNTLRAINIRFE